MTKPVDDAAALRWRINLLGIAAFVAYAAMTVLSYAQAPALWRAEDAPRIAAFFDRLAAIPLLGGHRQFGSSEAVVASYWSWLAVPTLACVLLAMLLTRSGSIADEATVRLLRRWSLAFAGVCVLAFPVFTQDMWLSAAWGRMIVGGVNPYYALFTPEFIGDLPLDHFPMVMSYGPLWALMSAVVMGIAGSSTLAAGILFKALLAAAWIGGLVAIERITGGRPIQDRCLAVGIYGWAPASVSQTLAEGHNDIVMVAFALMWLAALLRGHRLAPVALIASALCKYTTAPLWLVDAVAALRRERAGLKDFVLRQVAPGLVGLAILAVFFRSPAFFDGLKVVSEWEFLRPGDAILALGSLTGLPLKFLQLAVAAFFALHAAYWLAVAFWSPTRETLLKAAAAVMAAVMLVAVSHVWPWYVIWLLALTVILPGWWLSRFTFAVAMLMPFTLAAWWVEPVQQNIELAGLITYATAALWTLLTRQAPQSPPPSPTA